MSEIRTPRRAAAAQGGDTWVGSELIVWGGSPSGTAEGTGFAYDPTRDSWRRLSTVDAPTGLRGHSAIWTGTEYIVFGGVAGPQATNSAARYDPVRDHWTPLRGSQAETPRVSHSAVWTGREMILFGGSSAVGAGHELGDGTAYDPVTDRWRAISTENGPSPRFLPAATWTGSKMLVWGGAVLRGQSTFVVVPGGYSYDPEADRWTPISDVGGLAPRFSAASIWFGDTWLIWGGYTLNGASVPATGALYEP